jgi:hypothetical protein
MKSLEQLSAKKHFFTIALVLGALITSSIIVSPFFLSRSEKTSDGLVLRVALTHDLIQHLAVMKDFDTVLRSGHLYPRWLPDYNKGYGGPWMDFYPPGFYYLTSAVNLVTNDWIYTVFIVSILGLAGSGLAFYLLSRLFYGRAASVLAALLYMALSSHVVDLYWRGALPQFMGFIFLPMILYFAFRLGARGRLYDYAGLALFYGLFWMTHSPVSLLMTYALAFYALAWAARERDRKVALRIGVGMGLGVMLGAIYWLPAAYDSRYIKEYFSSLFPYHASYLTLMPGDEFSDVINNSFALQTLLLIVAILILRESFKSRAARERAEEPGESEAVKHTQTRLWIIMGVVTTFMTTPYSIYISRLLPKIEVATFAWRWLSIASLFAALVVAATVDELLLRAEFSDVRLWAYRAALALAIIFNVWFTVQAVIVKSFAHPTMAPPANYIDAGFTPVGAFYAQDLPDTPPVVINSETGASEVVYWKPYDRQVIVSTEEACTVRLKTYNYPGWSARLDGEAVALSSDESGAQLIAVPPGRHTLEVRFGSTPPRAIAAGLTVIGFLAVLGLALTGYARRSKERADISTAPARRRYTATAMGSPKQAGSPSPVAERVASDRLENRGPFKKILPLATVLLIVVIGLIVVLSIRRSGGPASVDNARSGATVAPRPSNMAVGSEVKLKAAGTSSILVAVDARALDEMVGALSLKDNSRVEGMVESGRLITITEDTRVRILEVGAGKIKVRILDGPNTLTDGWVPERWVR